MKRRMSSTVRRNLELAAAMSLASLGWPAALAAHPGHGVAWPLHLHVEQVALVAGTAGLVMLAVWTVARGR